MYYNEIDEHMKNVFDSKGEYEVLEKLPDAGSLEKMQLNKLYKVRFVSIAVDIVNFKKINRYTDPEIVNLIISEFTYGVTKIMKDFNGQNIDIQGDGIFGIFSGDHRSDIDNAFNCACALNTFRKHITKVINSKFPNQLKYNDNNYYNFGQNDAKLEFGIGVWFSFDNFITRAGHGSTKELIYIGESVNYANLLASNASRNNRPNILMNDLFTSNLTEEEKAANANIGQYTKVYIGEIGENVNGCNWIKINYNNFVDNNV